MVPKSMRSVHQRKKTSTAGYCHDTYVYIYIYIIKIYMYPSLKFDAQILLEIK